MNPSRIPHVSQDTCTPYRHEAGFRCHVLKSPLPFSSSVRDTSSSRLPAFLGLDNLGRQVSSIEERLYPAPLTEL